MSLRAIVTGAIAEPVLRWTGKQQAVLELRINATASQRNRDTGEWSDIGSPLWVSATFWEKDAQYLAGVVHQGDRVSVEGTLIVETYQRRDGGTGSKHVIRSPRFLGVSPKRSQVQTTGPVLTDEMGEF